MWIVGKNVLEKIVCDGCQKSELTVKPNVSAVSVEHHMNNLLRFANMYLVGTGWTCQNEGDFCKSCNEEAEMYRILATESNGKKEN